MTAGLITGKIDVNDPRATANASARSSVEISDSCNCCKFCFPCFGRKVKKDPRDIRIDRTTEIMREAFRIPETPRNTNSGRLVRSPGMENMGDAQPRVSIDIHVDSGGQ